MIDHIDRDRLNNTPTNLRWANSCMNNQNRTHNNNTGERHIFYHPRGYYVVAITKNYITTQKYASTLNDAIAYRDLLLLNID